MSDKEKNLPKEDHSKKSMLNKVANVFTTDEMKLAAEVKATKTKDGFDNFVSRVGLQNQNTLSAGTYEFNLITRNRIKLEAAYRGSWVVGAVVDSVAEDMTRAGINIITNEDDEDIKDLMNEISKLQISQSMCNLEKWARLYGGSIGVIQIEGQKLDTPLKLDSVAKGQFKGIVVYDRWQLNPVLDHVIQEGPNMGLPSVYQIVTGMTSADVDPKSNVGLVNVHHSRVIRDIGIQLPFFQAITEMMWGESELERLWDRLIAFDNVTMSAASLVDRANLRMVGINGLREILAAGGEAQAALLAQFEMMRLLQVNEGLTLLDKEDEYQSSAYTFAGLSDMMLQFGQQLAGASGIPLVRLFGQSPAGLSSTGDADIRMYYDNIKAKQEAKFRTGWQLIIQVLWQSVYGKAAPADLEFEFVPLWQMSAMDKATIGKTNTESIIGAYEANLTSRSTAMKELRESSGDTGLFTNISDEEIKDAEETDAELPPLPGEVEADPAKLPKSPEQPEPVKSLDAKHKSAFERITTWLSKSKA